MESDSPDPPVDTHSHGGARHPFERRPHRTLIGLAVPVLGSLIAEPITGLVDTAFVSRLGSEALAGLGVGAIALSAVFWVFNFLGIGTQTEVARALGSGVNRGPGSPAARASLAIGLAIIIGILAGVWGVLFTQPLASLLGASGPILAPAVVYMKIRWLGAPAMLVMLASFGAMRGVQDMRQPLVIAIAINVLNVALDAALIEGVGPIPAMGVAGAAWASTASQWCGAIASLELLRRSVGFSREVDWADARKLIRIGGDIFVRTGMLTLFLLVATRTATRLGPAEGAAHQAIRQVWIFTALFMDAWALSAQSLVGYFTGAARLESARRVARLTCVWSAATGGGLGVLLWLATPLVRAAIVPAEAEAVFGVAWLLALIFLPIGGLTFATDGIHWGTGDFAFLRKATTLATVLGGGAILLLEAGPGASLSWVWAVTGLWVTARAAFGIARIWPGIGDSPLAT